ncbi:Plasma membrane fusion protein prm1 [Pseudocercospora fuligena]|uniref:Plasma membrane fusion protein PRM1 n=1 Tax=Pseudocercospora fuligena TaxID=685502 RepID=A0A8H6VC08_9PEZI|nr:Plasma membrane fusion protein prm1 [Pseudocercospora fuligena]
MMCLVNSMAPSENQQQFPNPAPPSLSAGDHESRDYYAAQDASRPPQQNEPYLTPYLGLRARLSQTWINRWTILLLLVLVRTIIAIASVDDNLVVARRQALSACTSVENVGSAMASMPHYMSQGLNELTARSIEKAINGLMQMLILTLTGVEEIVVFVINLLTQTYLCLITLAVSGSLHVAVSVAEDVGDFLNSTAKDVGKGLSDVASDFQDAMNGFISGLNDLGSIFTGDDDKPPTIDLSSEIDKLNTLQLPTGYDQGLENLNKSIPTFAQVNNLTQTAIRFPFEEVKKLLNESLPRYTMNDSIFPVPAKEQLTFCSDNDGVNDFFDDLVAIKNMAKKVFLGVIITAAILVMAPMAWREHKRWKMMQERAHLVQENARDPLDVVYIVSRPYTSGIGLWFSQRFSSARRRDAVRWAIAYATTVPALFVLSLAIAGLLSCLCQYILLKSLEKEVPALENQIIEVLNCLVLLKIEGIQRGLTWVSEHAHIDIPMLPNDTFSLGTASKVSGSSENLLANGPDGAAADAISGAVDHVITALANGIRQEAIISSCVLLIWVIIASIGIFRALYMLWRGAGVGTYDGSAAKRRPSSSEDKLRLREVPTYEQATGIGQTGDHSGNKYNGQSYTLTPAPLPTFEVNSATSPIMHTGFSPPNEKTGTVNGRNASIRRQTHIRVSSHGDYAITSPMSPPQPNPFLSTNVSKDSRQNPFADPVR